MRKFFWLVAAGALVSGCAASSTEERAVEFHASEARQADAAGDHARAAHERRLADEARRGDFYVQPPVEPGPPSPNPTLPPTGTPY